MTSEKEQNCSKDTNCLEGVRNNREEKWETIEGVLSQLKQEL